MLSTAKFFYSTIAIVAATAELTVAAHFAMFANAAAATRHTSTSAYTMRAKAAPATQLTFGSLLFVAADGAPFAIHAITPNFAVFTNTFPSTVLA